jgi:molybdopterin-guanine dinucleotide biosynthesis protein B
MKKPPTPVVIFAGWSGSGKTTILEKLIPLLKERTLKVGTIKHHHEDFDIDDPGKDSWRHRKAGADRSIISSPGRIGVFIDTDHDQRPKELLPLLSGVDIVLVEGYKNENLPKVEIFRTELHDKPRFIKDPNLIAMITDADLDLEIPIFKLDDINGLADYLVKYFKISNA